MHIHGKYVLPRLPRHWRPLEVLRVAPMSSLFQILEACLPLIIVIFCGLCVDLSFENRDAVVELGAEVSPCVSFDFRPETQQCLPPSGTCAPPPSTSTLIVGYGHQSWNRTTTVLDRLLQHHTCCNDQRRQSTGLTPQQTQSVTTQMTVSRRFLFRRTCSVVADLVWIK